LPGACGAIQKVFMKKMLMAITICWFALSAMAQTDSTSSIVIHKDPRVDLLVKKQAQINEVTTREARRNIAGYRLQVINTSDRNAAISAKTKIYQLYPELKAYLLYQSPYFRLRVGNFKDKEEAESYRKSLSKEFPNNVFLVRDTIEVKIADVNQ
jgi:SPOR domain